MTRAADDRFKGLDGPTRFPTDDRFLPDGTDTRFSTPGSDGRFDAATGDGRFIDPTTTDIELSAKLLVRNGGSSPARGYSWTWGDSDFTYEWFFPGTIPENFAAARIAQFRDIANNKFIMKFVDGGHPLIRSTWDIDFPGLGLSGTMDWIAANTRFEVIIGGLHDALDAALGTEIDVTLTIPAGTPPT